MDEYVLCEPVGTSQVDPTIVVSELERRMFLGGAGIVAGHCAGLGADTTLVTLLGSDEGYGRALSLLNAASVTPVAITDRHRPTTRKRRYRAQDKTLLRINRLSLTGPDSVVTERIRKAVMAEVLRKPQPDLVLFADFNYGAISQSLVDEVAIECRQTGIMMAADNQASSDTCDICRFRGMSLVTPTEREARLSLRDPLSSSADMAARMRADGVAANVAVTLGPYGLVVATAGGLITMPALSHTPVDPVGAGDALFATTSMALRLDYSIEQAIWLGSVAAAVQVGRVGNLPISFAQLLDFIAAHCQKIMSHGSIPGVDNLVVHSEHENVVEMSAHKTA